MQTFAVYVDNKPGVLNRVASLFRRRAFNIESLTVGHTESAGLSRMTIVVDTDEPDRRLELLHDNVKKYGTVFNTVAPGTDLKGVLVRATSHGS